MVLTWNKFQKLHSRIGMSKKDMRILYKKYKQNKYSPPLCDLRTKKACKEDPEYCIWSDKDGNCYLD
uniref:Uncharacterized protein n=1 Tax=Marseillevirus LCMAC201 TaxID=2506605 RepID=A0A481YXP0_9VIRU|nr:MAG: hypothetical protein LCMAC201_01580 [Marseillevirus LCMAC201]